MLEEPKPNNKMPGGNQTDVRLEETPENKADSAETERKTETPTDTRSDARSTYTAKRAARYVAKDEKTIRNWIKSGRIHAEKVRGAWHIPKAELDAALVDAVRAKDRTTEQEQGSVRSSVDPANKIPHKQVEQEAERTTETPTDFRSDFRYEALESRVQEQERIIVEKDSRHAEFKATHEKQLTEKDQRLNEKDDRINDLKGDREKDRDLYGDMLKHAQQLIQTLQSQVAQLEAPKRPVTPGPEIVDGDVKESGNPEQGSEEQEKGFFARMFPKN